MSQALMRQPQPPWEDAPMPGDGQAEGGAAEEMRHTPPHNLAVEQELLGALLVNNDVLARVEDLIGVEDFYNEVHRRIFDAARRMIWAGQICTPPTLKTYFERDDLLAQVGGPKYLARLAAMATTVINARDYAEVIRGLALRRLLLDVASDCYERAGNPQVDEDVQDIVARLMQRLDRLETKRGQAEPLWHKDVMQAGLDAAELAYKRGAPMGVTTGLRSLDMLTGGMEPGNLIIIGARPSMGKTAFALYLALAAAREFQTERRQAAAAEAQRRGVELNLDKAPKSKAALFISLEMSTSQIGQRSLAESSGVPYQDMRSGRIDQDAFQKLFLAARQSDPPPLAHLVLRDARLTTIRQAVRRFAARHPLGLVVIDYLQLIRGEERYRGQNGVEQLGDISKGLKNLAGQMNCPIAALSQLNRDVEKRPDKRPNLADLRGSGDIEQDADDVWFLYREEYYREREEPAGGSAEFLAWQDAMEKCRGVMDIINAKNRHGRIGIAKAKFKAATNAFSDLDDGSAPPTQGEIF